MFTILPFRYSFSGAGQVLITFRNTVKRFNGTTKIKIGILGGVGLDKLHIFETYTTKVVENTPFGKPSSDLYLGNIKGVECVFLRRRGSNSNILPGNINYRANIWTLKEEECTHILATTTAGSLVEYIKPGDIVLINDFIDKTHGRIETFYDGDKSHPPGICYLPMTVAFDRRTIALLNEIVKRLKFDVHPTGTVVCVEGPRYASKAECNMFRLWEAQVINMTTVPEVILAKEVSICYASIALAVGYDNWKDSKDELHIIRNVIETFEAHVSKLSQIIKGVIPLIAKENWDQTRQELKDIIKRNTLP